MKRSSYNRRFFDFANKTDSEKRRKSEENNHAFTENKNKS